MNPVQDEVKSDRSNPWAVQITYNRIILHDTSIDCNSVNTPFYRPKSVSMAKPSSTLTKRNALKCTVRLKSPRSMLLILEYMQLKNTYIKNHV